ncbi:MAG: dephospho-CoA kinase [Proteobacteria bacterium]|nr:dephospho-CoA kinase [Pseudomonadota bacterium]
MGKSTVLGMFRDCGLPVFDADEEVRTLLRESAYLKRLLQGPFAKAFNGKDINRARLADLVLENEKKLRQLENMIHPIVMKHMHRFIEHHRKKKAPLIVLDIPLLFETGAAEVCNGTAVVSAPEEMQKKRALQRPNITGERLTMILGRQLPDQEKRSRADFILSTGTSLEQTKREVGALVKHLKKQPKRSG